jgi:Heparinase II/III-like protein
MTLCMHASADAAGRSKEAYIRAVTRGEGFLPWQEAGPSEAELSFRQNIEARKDSLLQGRVVIKHPALLETAAIERARKNIDAADWAKDWFSSHLAQADYLAEQPVDYVESMLSELTLGNPYGLTCPNCVGKKSQEGAGNSLFSWSHKKPDVLECRRCGQVYPDERFPETAELVCPRMGQAFQYYLNDAERANKEDRSGRLAWHWVGYPMHMTFSGTIRARKAGFMVSGLESLAYAYALTGEERYADMGVRILVRLAACYRNWLYHDYWDGIADCDPLYAAWHDRSLPIEWKRHLSEQAFKKDQLDKAAMMQVYWGAGRFSPSTDSISNLHRVCLAYDLLHDASWTAEDRALVERDLFLEWVMGAEPYVGGPGKADCINNKAPRIYRAFAAAGRVLGLPEYADTALRGYQNLRDRSFLYDGFSKESPAYTNMYLSSLIWVPETLHGFEWPAGYNVEPDLYASDERLQLMLRAVVDQLDHRGNYMPLSDSNTWARPSPVLIEIGMNRYPQHFSGKHPVLSGGTRPSEYAVFHLDATDFTGEPDADLPEILFPAWMTAILRHGTGPDASVLAMPFSPSGGHRHSDNLALCYRVGADTVLADLGYVGDMPVNRWIHSTVSHNLVVVDDGEQQFAGDTPRIPRLSFMATSPVVSVVEASSRCYPQCNDYRRLIALIKGPDGGTFAVDIFRVKGGRKHAYRVLSEVAASDVPEGTLGFEGLEMPPEPPLPEVGQSLASEDIYGLRDTRYATPAGDWQAVWSQTGRSYRLWMRSPLDRVEASNGPGQTNRLNGGRRLRYVDAVREGDALESVFVAVHEPSPGVIDSVEPIDLPETVGADAVALKIESAWGTYLVLSGFDGATEVEGTTFQGVFGVLHETEGHPDWLFALGATALKKGNLGFDGERPVWQGKVTGHTTTTLTTDSAAPEGWPAGPANCQNYIVVHDAPHWTGFPAESVSERQIRVTRFPLPGVSEFELRALRFMVAPGVD